MSGTCSTIEASLQLQITESADKEKYSGVFKKVIAKAADELAENYGFLDGPHDERKIAWLTFLDGPYDNYDKKLSDFDDIRAYKFILSAFFEEMPDLEIGAYTLTLTERFGGYDVSNYYDKIVIGEKQPDGTVKYSLKEQVKVWETKEI